MSIETGAEQPVDPYQGIRSGERGLSLGIYGLAGGLEVLAITNETGNSPVGRIAMAAGGIILAGFNKYVDRRAERKLEEQITEVGF